MLDNYRKGVAWVGDGVRLKDLPVMEVLDSSVLMFGGLNVDLGQPDVDRLMVFMEGQHGKAESGHLSSHVQLYYGNHRLPAHQEGYDLAEDLREALRIPSGEVPLDIGRVLNDFDIAVVDAELENRNLRGVAVAGHSVAPAILVNTACIFNQTFQGRRFTLAHELCHILYDRTRARKISHLSGPWASVRTERRANAFASMFLASEDALRYEFDRLNKIDYQSLRTLADDVFQMGITALIMHLYNLRLINQVQREELLPRH